MKNIAKGLFAVVAVAFLLGSAGAGVALAEGGGTFADMGNAAVKCFNHPKDFMHDVLYTPAGDSAWYHDYSGSKPVVNMIWGAPRPLLTEERMR